MELQADLGWTMQVAGEDGLFKLVEPGALNDEVHEAEGIRVYGRRPANKRRRRGDGESFRAGLVLLAALALVHPSNFVGQLLEGSCLH